MCSWLFIYIMAESNVKIDDRAPCCGEKQKFTHHLNAFFVK